MKICIDNRERTRNPDIDRVRLFENYIKSGKTKYIDGVITNNYKVSDYHTEDMTIGIEYKKDDLVKSITDKTLDKQLKELNETFAHSYLFIGYDGINDMIIKNIGFNPDALIGKISSILARQHVTVIFVGDYLVRFTCDVIEKHLDGKTKIKDIEYTPVRKKFLKRDPTIQEIRRAMFEQIPKLGSKKVNKLLEHFNGSFNDIALASPEQIAEVDGFGKKLADRIVEVLS